MAETIRRCIATNARGKPCSTPSQFVDPETSLCPMHKPGQREQMRAYAALGGQVSAANAKGKQKWRPGQGCSPFPGTFLDLMDVAGLTGSTWDPWRTAMRAVYGLPMSDDDLQRFARHTGRTTAPTAPVREAWFICGRRAGKSRISVTGSLFQAIRRDYTKLLAPGERATIPIIAADRLQARSSLSYLKGLAAQWWCGPYVGRVLKEAVEFRTGAVVTVGTASYRTTRGYTLAGVICEEVAFWLNDESGANPDSEVLGALRPGMATVPDALLLGISSPYAAKGELYKAHERYFGTDDDTGLVWNADTASMNPNVDPRIIQQAFVDDPIAAASEYGQDGRVTFRRDVESFLDAEAIRAVTVQGRREIAPAEGVKYAAFTDPSGGSQDAFTLAIAHRDGDRAVLDVLREVRPPFSPDAVVQEYAETVKRYGVLEVTGDHYAGEWPRERFRAHGVKYTPSDRTRSDIYRELLPLVNATRVELLDHPRLAAQLVGLERRTARSGKDSIDHAPGGHDDLANAAAGALALVGVTRSQRLVGVLFAHATSRILGI